VFFLTSRAAGKRGDHSFPSSAKVKNKWICIFTSPYTVLTLTVTVLLNPSLFAVCNSLKHTVTTRTRK
jgi:hypothetical protein